MIVRLWLPAPPQPLGARSASGCTPVRRFLGGPPSPTSGYRLAPPPPALCCLPPCNDARPPPALAPSPTPLPSCRPLQAAQLVGDLMVGLTLLWKEPQMEALRQRVERQAALLRTLQHECHRAALLLAGCVRRGWVGWEGRRACRQLALAVLPRAAGGGGGGCKACSCAVQACTSGSWLARCLCNR